MFGVAAPDTTALAAIEATGPDVRTSWPAFIVGCHRSGTTLLRYLLDAHPALACPPESKFLAAVAGILTYPQAMRGLASLGVTPARLLDDLRRQVEHYFGDYAARHGKRRWIDKTPNYVRLLPFLDGLFGREVLFILIVRHPLDTAQSLVTTTAFQVDEPEDPDIAASVARYGHDREGWVRHWVEITRTMLWFEARVADRTCVVKYEDLVTAPTQTVDRVLAFLNESRSPEIISDMLSAAFARTHSTGYEDWKIRTSGGIHSASVGKWTGWAGPEVKRLWDIAGEVAVPLGYDVAERGDEAHVVA